MKTEEANSGCAAAGRGNQTSRPAVFFVIPAYNESSAVGNVVRHVRTRFPNVVAVDDGSTDDTGRVSLEAGATLLTHIINRG